VPTLDFLDCCNCSGCNKATTQLHPTQLHPTQLHPTQMCPNMYNQYDITLSRIVNIPAWFVWGQTLCGGYCI